MFELICDALIGQDINTWERKSINNDRFFKLQNLASRQHENIQNIRKESLRQIEEVLKRV